ncbi:MAG: family 16 glycosylhydrolase [Flavobacteriales bacterium]|mgnify:FL=1|jgi:beta-glucanase (GH16 family)|nr:family 16 glycosylhydrolase [Flavobacteriales bacterium]
MKNIAFYIATILLISGCESCGDSGTEPFNSEIKFLNDRSAYENESNVDFEFTVKLDTPNIDVVTVDYYTEDISAIEGEDYISSNGTLVFSPGEVEKIISVTIIVDTYLESDEQFKLVLTNPTQGYLKNNIQEALGTIMNDDTDVEINNEGYTSAESYEGMELVWSDEFEGTDINSSNWTYDLGTGNSGWGNNELQNYVQNSDNSYVQNDNLFLVAREMSNGQYASARLKSQGLQNFTYGRIDIRAILPIGQGLWPAIWMLGSNFQDVGWPACGEIDIMELVGSNPRRVHGTAHWGANNSVHQQNGTGTSLPFPDTFADEYHVFSIDWQENQIIWLLDDVEFFTINSSQMNGQSYPFNNDFFFILNIAVGGNWPGDPDESTLFPVYMAIDYVRVFQ